MKERNKKRGFTLVELAIVLVVIGVLLGLAMKGAALLDAAKVKADLNKINKISSGIAEYYSLYDKLPGGTQKEIYDNLTKTGILGDSDFKISTMDKYWMIIKCGNNSSDSTSEGWLYLNSGKNLCAVVSEISPEEGGKISVKLPLKLFCYMESAMDNKNWKTGDGRYFNFGAGSEGNLPDMGDWDCAKISDTPGNYAYGYRVY